MADRCWGYRPQELHPPAYQPFNQHSLREHESSSAHYPSSQPSLKLNCDVWNRIHELGISRKRTTHRGSKGNGRRRRSAQNFLQSTNLQAIPVLISPREKANVRNQVCVKNLISIKPVNNNNASINRKYDMPNLFLTNARSLKNKFDEISVVVNKYDVDLLAITETWLDANTPIDYFPLSGFSTFSKPRTDKKGGGVAAYIKHSFKPQPFMFMYLMILKLWIHARPPRLPRKIAGIILCAVYFPPKHPNADKYIDHMLSTIDNLSTRYPDAGVAIVGDFNDLDLSQIVLLDGYVQVVDKPTRDQKYIG